MTRAIHLPEDSSRFGQSCPAISNKLVDPLITQRSHVAGGGSVYQNDLHVEQLGCQGRNKC